MSYRHRQLEVLKYAALKAVEALNQAAIEELQPGTLVDYSTGGRWVGPCEVVWVSAYSSCAYGPSICVKNLKSGKSRVVSGVTTVRPHEPQTGGESDA